MPFDGVDAVVDQTSRPGILLEGWEDDVVRYGTTDEYKEMGGC